MDTLTEHFFDTGELSLQVMEGPRSGEPLVLLHGATGSWTHWMPVVPALAQKWHLHLLTLRGHGKAGRPAGLEGYHITRNIHDTLAFLREYIARPCVFVGHSYGAITGLLTASLAGDFLRALVLEDPPLMLRRESLEDEGFSQYFRWLHDMRQTARTYDEVRAVLAERNPGAPEDALNVYAQNVAWLDPTFPLAITTGDRRETMHGVDYGEHIRGISCPVLLMQADPARGGALVDEDADFFMQNAPNARRVRFPDTGHGIHGERPAEFLQAIDDFLAGL